MHQQHIADRLRHLLAVDVEKAVVQPVARENLAAMRAGRLRDLVLVVRKDQVVPAPVPIDALAQPRFAPRPPLATPAPTRPTPPPANPPPHPPPPAPPPHP